MATMSMQTSLVAKPAAGLTRRSAPTKSRTAMVRAPAYREHNAIYVHALRLCPTFCAQQQQ